MSDIHLFEPSGYAGVFQHSCRLATILAQRGLNVSLHTGHQHEAASPDGFDICPCTWWPRGGPRSPRRSAEIAVRFATRTLPHLRRVAGPGSVLHVQGIAAAGPLTLLALGAARAGPRRVVYSPHDTFSRRGRLDGALLRRALRVPHAVIVHSRADVDVLRSAGIHAHLSPLVQVVPVPSAELVARWREEWRVAEGDEVVLFAGWIRPEKRLDLLIESARSWPANRRLAVVGPDRGAWESCARLARRLGVDVSARVEFAALEDFAAAMAAADVVVAPHDTASQSGVLAVARQLGVPTIAAAVGGLPELATGTFPPGDVAGLTRALDAVLARSDGRPPPLDEELALQSHLRAYGMADAR